MERALGEAFYSQGRIDDALEHLTRSSQIQPTDIAFFNIGTIKFQQKKFEKAAFYYRKVLEYPGEARTLAQIHNNLAVLEMEQGSLADAEKHFRESVALDPASARHRVAYGWLLAKQARYDEAISQYEEAVKTVPDALACFSLGSALEEQHKLSQAAEAYRKTLALAPSFQEAQLRLKLSSAQAQTWRTCGIQREPNVRVSMHNGGQQQTQQRRAFRRRLKQLGRRRAPRRLEAFRYRGRGRRTHGSTILTQTQKIRDGEPRLTPALHWAERSPRLFLRQPLPVFRPIPRSASDASVNWRRKLWQSPLSMG
jgi:tetratricopeptide (TPR) repeat protein